ncbi:MAG TPA: tRNA (adenosine(37)-N6)-dimethylallyltransferase MiaA [Erysipelotrichaceae bacterium]|nr:tRNA (adenosine(37)-N6)-dimethylallyltransferase MiaA [Erysipelotrichaceae bacterium]
MPKVLVIVGPTAIGKTALSVDLAQRFNGEIINGDSIQVYRGLNIGSAKVTENEKKGIVHHLLDYKDLTERYDVATFQKDAREKIREINERGKTAVVVGGTGLYIKALLYDYEFVENPINIDENKYNDLNNEQLHQRLKELDKESAKAIHPNNRKRIIRALILAESGTKKSTQEDKQAGVMIYDVKIIGLTMDRQRLKKRIHLRVDRMIEEGLVEEINQLFSKYSLDSQGFAGIGYKEMIPYYLNQEPLEKCVEKIKTHTRQFAKRQFTWFNNQMKVDWYNIEEDNYLNKIYKEVEEFLNG